MKAPSALCLQTLRYIVFPPHAGSSSITRRCYASIPPTPPPPPPKSAPTAIQRAAPQPGYKVRQKSSDDEDFTPRPLSRSIGMPTPPQPGENVGVDKRSLQQRRDDFVDYDKHLVKRARMTKQISKPYFRDWSNLRFHKGKVFVANEQLFRAEHALFFPNFVGRTLRQGLEKRDRKDGYGGLGRDTCEVMKGKVSVVSFVTNTWAQGQVDTFCSPLQNPGLKEAITQNKDVAQRVEINYEDNLLKWWVLRLFGLRGLRKRRDMWKQERYFIVRRGLSEIIKEAIGLLNDKGGYVYLVDQECRIRWAGSAIADESEQKSLTKGLRKLVAEARVAQAEPEKKTKLEAAVAELVKGAEKKAAAG